MTSKPTTIPLRQRRFYMVLPLLVLPFMTMAFWAMGGGQGNQEEIAQTKAGLNLQLPDANLKAQEDSTKLSFYNQADKDALKRLEIMQTDPYYRDTASWVRERMVGNRQNTNADGLNLSTDRQASLYLNEQKIYQKIDQLNQQINAPVESTESDHPAVLQKEEAAAPLTKDVDRLQQMMQSMTEKQGEDPEMKNLNGMLEKIIDIQHPERVNDQIKSQSLLKKTEVFAVSTTNALPAESYFGKPDTVISKADQPCFYDNSDVVSEPAPSNAVAAVIQETQTLVSGSTVKLRLLSDSYVNGQLIPSGNFVYGTASLEDERLLIHITAIRYQNSVFPVSLSVYDLDGMEGIHMPGSLNRDAAKQAAEQSMQSMELMNADPSLHAQMAAAGINAAKALLTKKAKLVRVMVKAGYQVLLQDGHQQND